MGKENLSAEGQRLYDESGYHETTIPFIHEDYKEREKERGSPFYLTFDFVLDEELQEKFNSFDYEDQHGFFTKNRVSELLSRGFVFDVSGGEPIVEDVDEFNAELESMHFFDS